MIKVECSPLKIDNALFDSIKTNQWGIRIVAHINDDSTSRFEFVLDKATAEDLILKIQKSLDAMESVARMNRNLTHGK